ncbi:10659_t:CDS:2 [Rhizophagus irregularis]|nr:10659_t:CDS:2 [Rhizophagus irregularis]
MGPAGTGKSTYCATMINHCQNIGRSVHLMNLDPAAEKFEYSPSIEYEDDYLIIDCPGQIELYTHFPIMRRICDCLQRMHFRICGVYLLESQFIEDNSKFFAGVMSAMSAMISLEIPHINVLSKMDLLGKVKKQELERYFDPDPLLLTDKANASMSSRFHDLNKAIVQLIDDYNMVSFLPLNITDEDSITTIMSHVDNALQFEEDQEPKEPKDTFDVDYDE